MRPASTSVHVDIQIKISQLTGKYEDKGQLTGKYEDKSQLTGKDKDKSQLTGRQNNTNCH